MLLKHGLDDFEELQGQPFECSGCHMAYPSEGSISVNMCRPNGVGGVEMAIFLICTTCTLLRCDCQGRA